MPATMTAKGAGVSRKVPFLALSAKTALLDLHRTTLGATAVTADSQGQVQEGVNSVGEVKLNGRG